MKEALRNVARAQNSITKQARHDFAKGLLRQKKKKEREDPACCIRWWLVDCLGVFDVQKCCWTFSAQ